MRWNPERYLRLADERGRPFHDLTGRIGADAPRRVVDLGCGPGNHTAVLAARWPDAAVLGIDSSPEMIDAARAAQPAPPNLRFVVGDIAEWTPDADTDVVVSNAALQWVPGHDDLIRQWMRTLPAGAWLAFQVPGNFGAPSHRLMRELAQSPRWAHELRDALRVHDEALEPDAYAQIALDAGWRPDVWETTYMHLLGGTDPVLEWVRGTGLRPIVAALRPQDRADFEAEYARQLREAYPARRQRASIAGPGFARAEERNEHTTDSAEQSGTAPDEVTLFPFRRIFCVAQRD